MILTLTELPVHLKALVNYQSPADSISNVHGVLFWYLLVHVFAFLSGMTDKPSLLVWNTELKNGCVHSGECVNHSVCKCPPWTSVRSFGSLQLQDVMVYIHSWQRGRLSLMVIFDLKQVDFLHVIYVWLCWVGGFGFSSIMITNPELSRYY